MRILILPSLYPNLMKKDLAPYVRDQALSLSRNGLDVTLVYTAPYSWRWVFHERRILLGRREKKVGTFREIIVFIPKSHIRRIDLAVRNVIGRWILSRLTSEGYTPDVVHAHSYEAGRLAAWFCRRQSLPLILTEHYTGFARGLVGTSELSMAVESYRKASVRLAVSAPFADLLLKQTGCRFDVMPNFIDTDYFSPQNSTETPYYDFIAVGHLLPKKNHQLLIEAFAYLNPAEQRLRLGIVGDGPLRRELKRIIHEKGLTDNVDLLGYRDTSGVRGLLRQSRIYCMPSRFETFGVAVIEAMAIGLPAVVTRSGGPEYIVEHGAGGFIADSAPKNFSSAMKAALEENWDRTSIRRNIVDNYSEKVVIEQLKALYHHAKKIMKAVTYD